MHYDLYRLLLAAGSVAALACAAPAYAQVGNEHQFNLPAQELSVSLREVSLLTGQSVIARSDLVAGRQAPAVSGSFTAERAVQMLLIGSGLDVRRVGEALVVSAAGAAPGRGPSSGTVAAADEQEIVVTGTNIRGAQPTSPVIVVRRDEIEASGASSVEQLVGRLPQNAQAGVNRENFRVVGAGADPTEHGAGLNLRGLGQRATLVLINGRRVAPSNVGSFVDVSLIPLTVIERVEILSAGASAIYGSDAVGGVVNFILRDDFEGVEAMLTGGTATRGDGDIRQAAVTAGTSWPSGGALLSYEYRAEDEIVAADRDFTINLAPQTSLLPRERRHSIFGNLRQTLAADLRAELAGSFSRRDTRRSYFFGGSPVPVDASAEAETISVSGSLSRDISGSWTARLTGGYSVTRTDEEQVQTGGSGLVNGRATRNAIADLGMRADGPLFDLPAGPVRVALGIEARREWYRDRFRTAAVSVPTDFSRDVAGAFGETQVPIVSPANRRPGVEQLLFTAAARFERYEGFGSSFDPRVGLLWSPLPGVSFRTSYDTSFRAPLLSEAAGTYSAILAPAALVYLNPAEASGVALVMGGFNPAVRPERSRSWTIGGEFAPAPGLTLNLNHYSIRFANRIAQPAQVFTVVGDPGFESIVTRSPAVDLVRSFVENANLVLDISGPGFSNGNATPADVTVIVDNRTNNTALTTTSGMDALLQYRFRSGGSQFLVEANANYIFSFKDRLRPTSPLVDGLDRPYRPLKFRTRAHLGWQRGGWSANVFANHADDYLDDRGGRSLQVDSHTTVDVGLAYELGGGGAPTGLRGTRIALQVDNLLNTAPPRLLPDPGSTVGFGYDPVNASARGRFVSLQLRTQW
jgi:outer membrane receptor protein involved in Fe transport